MNRLFAISIGLMSLCVSASGQEKIPVEIDMLADYSVATNPFSQNWELSLGLQGLSFYSNQESVLDLSQSPFMGFRTQLGIAMAATKWFSPEIALRTKLSGFWGRSVSSDDRFLNSVNYFHLHEDVMVNLSNIIGDYQAERPWNAIPYIGIGMVRNFTHNENALALSLGMVNTYRLTERMKAFLDLSFTVTGDEFDDRCAVSKNIFSNHDRWIAAEIGVIFELGQNRWKHVPDMDDVEVVPWFETERELKRTRRKVRDLAQEVDYYRSQQEAEKAEEPAPQPVVTNTTPAVSIFFEIGTAELNHKGQLENIKEIVETAIQEDRIINVAGYADSSTGNGELNERLSARRADTVAKEIIAMGVNPMKINIIIGGGVSTLNPLPANRRVVVSLGE